MKLNKFCSTWALLFHIVMPHVPVCIFFSPLFAGPSTRIKSGAANNNLLKALHEMWTVRYSFIHNWKMKRKRSWVHDHYIIIFQSSLRSLLWFFSPHLPVSAQCHFLMAAPMPTSPTSTRAAVWCWTSFNSSLVMDGECIRAACLYLLIIWGPHHGTFISALFLETPWQWTMLGGCQMSSLCANRQAPALVVKKF